MPLYLELPLIFLLCFRGVQGVQDFQLNLTYTKRRLKGTLESFAIALEGCTRCTRFSIGFEIGPKEDFVA